ncbi:MAG: dTDP-4-dehydrorhamnose 3,5-epimerase [Miltoncostaeaceae bacterium]|nr:dTDP-4-dehydrorhamnose 3,5-epimerase [Miltoncostaeaceae bacterium]
MIHRLPTRLEGPVLLEPALHGDERGFFLESYRAAEFAALGIDEEWVQDNHSRSARGVLRGMHFQVGQAKLVRCARGAVLDVALDIRRGSPTFGQCEAVVLDDRTLRMLYLPVGFAHGFCVTSEVADVVYKCSSYYDAGLESGVSALDPALGIPWPEGPLTLSERDRAAPALAEVADALPFVHEGSAGQAAQPPG